MGKTKEENITYKNITLVIYLFLVSELLVAGEQKVSSKELAFDEKALAMVDGVHDSLSDHLILISNYIDNFFADERMEEEDSSSKVVLSYLTSNDQYRGAKNEYTLKARIHLPKTEKRLRLIIDSNVDDESFADANTKNLAASETRFNELRTALQYILLSSKLWQVSTHSGVRFSIPLNPYAKLRIRRLFFVKTFKLRLIQSLYWYKTEGWGETTSFDIEKSLSKKYFFRSNSQAVAIRDTGQFSFAQTFSIFQDIGKKKIMVYSVGSNADLNLPAVTTSNFINAKFRHNFYKKWAFYEAVPSITWERENNFNASAGFLFRLDIVFG